MASIFGQTFEAQDLAVIALLVLLEGVLSIDNAMVLGLLAKRLPRHLQKRALTYGLFGAFAFRILAVVLAAFLLEMSWPKLVGGAYLVYIALKHLIFERRKGDHAHIHPHPPADAQPISSSHSLAFWWTVGVIELTDIAFAIDSIVAAMALVGTQQTKNGAFHEKLWVVIVGGMLGVIAMRFAAVMFIRLLHRFPRLELAAYLLVLLIGVKMTLDWIFNTRDNPDTIDFHSPASVPFWIFWVSMAACLAIGFIKPAKAGHPPDALD